MVARIVHEGPRPFVETRTFAGPDEAHGFREEHLSDPGVRTILCYSDVETEGIGLRAFEHFGLVDRSGWAGFSLVRSSLGPGELPLAGVQRDRPTDGHASTAAAAPKELAASVPFPASRRLCPRVAASPSEDPSHSRRSRRAIAMLDDE